MKNSKFKKRKFTTIIVFVDYFVKFSIKYDNFSAFVQSVSDLRDGKYMTIHANVFTVFTKLFFSLLNL